MSTFSVGASMMVAPEEGRRFYGESEVIPESVSAEQAMQLVGMDYEVKTMPIFDDKGKRITGYKATYRDMPSNEAGYRTFGVVTDRYKVVPNRDVFTLCDVVAEQYGAKAFAGGIIDEGRKAWMLMHLPEPIRMAGEDILPWLMFINGHDGAQGWGSLFIPYRPMCTNAIPWSFKTKKGEKSGQRGVKLIHTGDTIKKAAEARHIADSAHAYFEKIARIGDQLAGVKVGARKLNRWLEEMYPAGTTDRSEQNAVERRETVKQLVATAPNLEGHHDTAYAFVQAVAEVADWGSSRQRDRMDRLAWNADGQPKNKALALVLDSVN